MKLHRLQIENFGIFRDRQVEFAGDGLQLVFGPNEAGKSTLLQLVREMLFGFPHRSPYALADHTGEMAATAEASLSDGRHLTYRRRKGRTNTVVGRFGENDAETVDAVALARLLGGAGAELYQNVFGFSLRELSSGEQSLRGAHLDEALYGGAIGGLANFQRVQQSLQSELDALFAPRGATKTINVLLSEIKETGRRLRDASVKPAVYRQLLQACSEQDDLVKRYRGELDQLRRRQARLARLEEAIPVRLRLLDARRQLGELDVPDDFPTDAEDEFRQTNKRLESLRQDLVAQPEGAREWAGILAGALRPVLADPALHCLLDDAELPADARSAFAS